MKLTERHDEVLRSLFQQVMSGPSTRRAGAANHVIVSRHDVAGAGVAWFCERCRVSGTWVENKPIQRTMTGILPLGVSLAAAFIHRHRGCSRSS